MGTCGHCFLGDAAAAAARGSPSGIHYCLSWLIILLSFVNGGARRWDVSFFLFYTKRW